MLRTRSRTRGALSGAGSIMDTAGVFGNQFIYAFDSRSVLTETPDPWTASYNTHYFSAKSPHVWGLNKAGHLGLLLNGAAGYATGGVDVIEFRDGTVNAQYANSIASSAKNVLCLGEVNGVTGYTFEQLRDAWRTVLAGWVNAGKRVYLYNGMPLEGVDAATEAIIFAQRDWLEFDAKAEFGIRNIIPVNSWDAVAQGRTTNLFKVGYNLDDRHQTVIGASAAGMEALYPQLIATIMPNNLTDTWRENASGVINTNPQMTGSTGTIGTRWANGGNGCPDNWSTGNNGGASLGLTATLSKETRADGYDWWKVVVTGTPASAGAELTLSSAIDYTQFAADSFCFLTGWVEWENASNIHTICLQTQATGGTTKRSRSVYGIDDTNLFPATSSGPQKQRTAAGQRIAGTTAMIGGLYIRAGVAAATTATIWIRDLTARVDTDPPS